MAGVRFKGDLNDSACRKICTFATDETAAAGFEHSTWVVKGLIVGASLVPLPQKSDRYS